MRSILKLIILIYSVVVFIFVYYGDFIIENASIDVKNDVDVSVYLDSLDLSNVDKVMIVAHPDDEMLWGGTELIKEDYLVVCITCGVDSDRVVEFKNVMNEVEDEYIMLGYPDLTDGVRDDWSSCYEFISGDIKEILEYKDWSKIVTHNPLGEYGHQHHIMTSEIVTSFASLDKLYYFEKYYNKDEIDDIDNLVEIDEELLERKKEILKLYTSQSRVVDVYSHMLNHEELIEYSTWS